MTPALAEAIHAYMAQASAQFERMLDQRPSLTLVAISVLLFAFASLLGRLGSRPPAAADLPACCPNEARHTEAAEEEDARPAMQGMNWKKP